jgi:lactoylglutathione lyase
MKRFHVHLSVADLAQSIRFYSAMFASPPTVHQADYAKWMIEDPRLNFAISSRGQPEGVNHLGVQVDTSSELRGMRAQLEAADAQLIREDDQPCCYARSDKYWVTDPAGIAWETFHTLTSIPVYGENTPLLNDASSVVADARACCVPTERALESPGCCAK